jgi:4-amino-4-deoxy-L-arabinose transferase-like glycosyltransferase
MPERRWVWLRRHYAECLLAILSCAVFLGCLGSLELWGKREQRAVAESIDTVDNGHWLVAEIQGRPRLEKPPLPRWTTSLLMILTGRRDEWLMRLPAALSALGMVAVAYALGKRIGGRHVGLAAGFSLISMSFFVVEMRQAGNDGPLAFFLSLAIYCAWRRLYSEPEAGTLGPRRWSIAMYAALGLGFLCKGPVVVMLYALAVLPYLLVTRQFKRGMRALFDGWGLLLMVAMMLSWPIAVLVSMPRAFDVWMLEMGQKAGTAGITHHRWRGPLATEWGTLTAPWTVLVTLAVIVPVVRRGRGLPGGVWLAWFWAVANLFVFCFWSVAKPNYYLPCMPAIAILGGLAWSWLATTAQHANAIGGAALRLVRVHWIGLGLFAVGAAAVVCWKFPTFAVWGLSGAAVLLCGVAASVWFWIHRRVTDSLISLVAASSVLIVVAYGVVGPQFNDRNGHRRLARQVARLVPQSERTVLFYSELDEGLWYYLRGRKLQPVLQPRYNKALDLLDDFKAKRIIWNDQERYRSEAQTLVKWLESNPEKPSYMLIKAKTYDIFRTQLTGLAEPVYREPDLERNELVLLRLEHTPAAVAKQSDATNRTQRR